MGETAPPQTPSGGLGIGVAGVGLIGGGSVAPRVHSAIVERLRARIAVCRQHHLSCEGRYERSRAESSDRERENTLQLLTLVQHGQGPRKGTKHSKNTCAPPPDYHHHQQQHQLNKDGNGNEINGDHPHQTTSNGLDQRNSALIAFQGSLKRKLVANGSPAQNKTSNGISDNSFMDYKKIRVNDRLSMGQNIYHGNDGLPHTVTGSMPVEQGLQRKINNPTSNTNCDTNEMFNLTLKDIKKEPGENMPCSKHLEAQMPHDNLFKYVDEIGDELMDPDLQELFNELTYISVPPMSDIELQNMINITIKQDDSFNIDIGQQTQSNTPTSTLPMDKIVIKSEYPESGSPQMRPSSTGPPYAMSSVPLTSSPNTTISHNQSQTQVSSTINRSLTSWQELSHAQQLKQIAANRQQHSLIQQHQTNQSSNWSNVSPTRPSSRPFGHEKVPSPFRQQQLSPHSTAMSVNGSQAKVLSNYLYKPNPSSQSNHIDVLNQQKTHDSSKSSIINSSSNLEHNNTKPLFHFHSDQANQKVSSVLSSQSKPILQYTQQQQQASLAAQQHEQSQQSKPLPGQTLQRSAAFQQKMITQKAQQNTQIPGLHYPAVHQQQDQHSGATQVTGSSTNPSSCTSPSPGSGYNSQQPMINHQLMEKTNLIQRQMIEQKQQLILQQQQMLAGTEKSNTQDQLNRHLTRPPPDYKDQRRSTVSMQKASQYTSGLPNVGVSSNPSISNSVSTHNITPQNIGSSSGNHGSRVPSLQGVQNMYGNISCPQQAMYNVNPGVQNNPNQIVTTQNNQVLQRKTPVAQGINRPPFVAGAVGNPPQFRPGVNQGTNLAGQRPPNVMTNSPASQNWVTPEAKKHDTLCFPNGTQFSNQSLQAVLGNQHFTQRALAPLNQISPGVQMKSISAIGQSNSAQTMEQLRTFNNGQTQLRAQLLPNLNQGGGSTTMTANTFTSTSQGSRDFPGTDNSNDLGSFDFLSQNNNGLGSALNSDSDFIDALLKTGHNNDDWMKDINLDEIFRNSS